ncbi:AAA family ATPase [Namhaeicola litoreus]|uniref:AAA family ATPase n=1 Tax=Namhaeicola litoreus TaxID=1052145 RepID=A0ABW3Y3A6_9FLAO
MPRKIVLTGGPGTGKSTIIDELSKRNFRCMPEISRQVTLKAQSEGINQLFLADPIRFSELLLKGRLEQFQVAEDLLDNPIFFDRGLPDISAYLDFLGIDYPEPITNTIEAHPYELVFILPPWKDIYTDDNERYENYSQAEKIHHFLFETYSKLGYDLVEVPKDTVISRVDFILKNI